MFELYKNNILWIGRADDDGHRRDFLYCQICINWNVILWNGGNIASNSFPLIELLLLWFKFQRRDNISDKV